MVRLARPSVLTLSPLGSTRRAKLRNGVRTGLDSDTELSLGSLYNLLRRRNYVTAHARRVAPLIESTFTACMEQLQEGYVSAVAATAGCTLEPIRRDLYGTDVRIIRPGATPHSEEIMVMAQLKNTTQVKPDASKEFFSYQLKKREYFEKLAMRRSTNKAILLVMATEPSQTEWCKCSHDAMELRNCCYWLNLEGRTAAEGVQAPMVRVPNLQYFRRPGSYGNARPDRKRRGGLRCLIRHWVRFLQAKSILGNS